MAVEKTNAIRMLDRLKVEYTVHTYDSSDGKIDGITVARKIKRNPVMVFKTLVTQGGSGQYYCFVIPVAHALNLKSGAKSVGEKSVSMIKVLDINAVTGYIRGGCSPIGMKKQYQTVFDISAENLETIVVSGGKIGVQIEMKTEDLLKTVNAGLWDLIN